MVSDELELVRRLGGEPPAFDAAMDARIRARVAEKITASGDVPPPGFEAASDDVLTVVGATGEAPRGPDSRRGVLVAAAVLLVGLVTAGLLIRGQGADEQEPTVNDVAASFRAGEHLALAPGQMVESVKEITAVYRERTVHRMRADGTGIVEDVDLSTGEIRNVVAYTEPGSLGLAGFSYQQLQDLPGDPALLREAITAQSGSSNDAAVVRGLVEVAATPVTPPVVRGAAIDALGELGAVVEGDGAYRLVVPDSEGRRFVIDVDTRAGLVTVLTIESTDTGEVLDRVNWVRTDVIDE